MSVDHRRLAALFAAASLALAGPAQASLTLDTTVTGLFDGGDTTSTTIGSDLNPRPTTLYFGQLKALASGFVDFFYVGKEAASTNTFNFGTSGSFSTLGETNTFLAPHELLGSIQVVAGSFLDFGFCTTAGTTVGGSKCADNDNATSLVNQYNYGTGTTRRGYRSIGFDGLTSYDPTTGQAGFGGSLLSNNLWMIFWDDSGFANDDNHDDLIIGARFRPAITRVLVSEPASVAILAIGLLGATLVLRRRMALNRQR